MGMALAGNLLTLFVFYEMLTLSTYPLVTHSGSEQARRSGRLYLGLLLAPSLGFLLFALIWTWQLAGTLDFVEGGSLRGTASPTLLGILFALYAFWHQQDRAHAPAPLVTGGHGGTHTGKRPAARCGCGQGRRVFPPQGHPLCVRY
jgi:NADH:ubiquinone oxidoreductase subunit 5 (subunit L)/multisubunit Na+/H+ antiporter MnhA subunit